MAKKAPLKKKKDIIWEKLAKELRDIIPKLDTEGLAFLVEQSRIHLYNMQVDELNKLKEQSYSKAQKTKAAGSGKSANNPGIKIDSTSSGFYMRGPKGGTMFSKSEMVKMIKIVNGPGSNMERAGRLYSWLVRERSDVLGTLNAQNPGDAYIQALAANIFKNFKLK